MNAMKKKILSMKTHHLLGIFLLLDLLALSLYGLYSLDVLESRFFRLARDRGFAEIIQYLKFGIIIQVLLVWNQARSSRLISAWILLFVIMLIDDSVGIHEEISRILMTHSTFTMVNGFRAKDLVEACVFCALEGSACLYIAYNFIPASRDLKLYSMLLGLAMIPLIFCGMVLDILHVPYLEQGGEMASMGLLLGVVHYHFMKYVRPKITQRSQAKPHAPGPGQRPGVSY